ncbi:MAG: hypothetical protein JNM39_03640 [Bdellovibrionaceae bacterium]|nr:hypothetical protein [Pseudobdellovibrionaceae bacterium]
MTVALKEAHLKRLQLCADFAHITKLDYSSVDDVIVVEPAPTPKAILISVIGVSTKEEIAGQVQTLRQFFPNTFIIVLVEKKLSVDDSDFVKKSGGNFVILSFDLLNSTQIEFILSQVGKESFVLVGAENLKVGTKVDFTLYAKLALNNKIVPVLQAGTEISQSRMDKMKAVGNLHIRKGQIDLFSKYIKDQQDNSESGLRRRCRVQLQYVAILHVNLVLLLLDQGEQGSYEKGRELLTKIYELCDQLLNDLKLVSRPWDILDQADIEVNGQVDRSVVIACLAAATSLRTGVGVARDILMAGLFCDLGLLQLSPKCLGHLNSRVERAKLDAEDFLIYKNHPVISLRILLERKIQMSEGLKEIILCTHEQADRQGFPNAIVPEKIPVESTIILFHEVVDLEWRVSHGQNKISYPEVWQDVYKREHKSAETFALSFLERISWENK